MLYQFCFSLSRRCDSLQKDNGIFLKFCHLTDEGIDTQRVLGTAVGSRSVKREIVNSAKNSSELLQEVVKEAIENEYLITLMIDDWTKVYTKRRPTDESTSVADNFCTIISRLSKTSRPFHGRRLKPFTTPRELMWKVYLFFFFHSPLLKTFLSHMQQHYLSYQLYFLIHQWRDNAWKPMVTMRLQQSEVCDHSVMCIFQTL